MRIQGFLRALPGGAGSSGKTATLRETAGGTTVATDTTDADGFWDFQLNGNPYGRLNVSASDGPTTRKVDSRTMGLCGAFSLYELGYVLLGLCGGGVSSGVVKGDRNELAVTATGTRQFSVNTGSALVAGIVFVNYAASSPATAGSANASGNPRIDTIVIEVTRLGQTEEGKAILKIVEGTPAPSPVAPTLTQNASTWQFPLADATLANGASSYASLVDRRAYLLTAGVPRSPTVDGIARITSTSDVTVTSTSGEDVTALNVPLMLASGVVYDVVARASVMARVNSTSYLVSIAPYIDGTGNAAAYLGHGLTANAAIPNVHVKNGIVGTGAAINCGVLVKKSSAAAVAVRNAAILHVRAIPRN